MIPHITIEQAKILCANTANAELWAANQNALIDAYNEKQTNEQKLKDEIVGMSTPALKSYLNVLTENQERFRIIMRQKLCDGAQSANIYQAAALKQPTPWTGSRKDVLALLAEFKVI